MPRVYEDLDIPVNEKKSVKTQFLGEMHGQKWSGQNGQKWSGRLLNGQKWFGRLLNSQNWSVWEADMIHVMVES